MSSGIGKIGQAALVQWAAEVNATANSSLHDERGWDVLLQFHDEAGAGAAGPLDKRAPQYTERVNEFETAGVII